MIVVENVGSADDQERELDRWQRIGARLAELDPARFARALELAATYVSIYETPEQSEDAFQARLRGAGGSRGVS